MSVPCAVDASTKAMVLELINRSELETDIKKTREIPGLSRPHSDQMIFLDGGRTDEVDIGVS